MAAGLFGNIYDTQTAQQNQLAAEARGTGQGWAAMTTAARELGGAIGQGVGRAFGGVTPQEQKMAELEKINSSMPDFDPTDPEAVDQPRFAEFARTSPLFGRGANEQALGQFQQAVNTSRGINPLGTGFDALPAGQQDILNPQSAAQAGILSSLANQAARARYGVGAEFLGNRDFGSEFFGQGRNTQAQSFADFLNQRIFGG